MPVTMLLPDDEADTAVAFDLPADLAPYARELYEARAKNGETLDDFICRYFCEDGVRHVMQTKVAKLRAAAATAENEDQLALGLEYKDLLNQ